MKRDYGIIENNEIYENLQVFRIFRNFRLFRNPFSFYSKQRLPVFNRLPILDEDFGYCAARFGRNLVHQLHCFDYAEYLSAFHLIAKVNESVRVGRWGAVKSADDRRRNDMQVLFLNSG